MQDRPLILPQVSPPEAPSSPARGVLAGPSRDRSQAPAPRADGGVVPEERTFGATGKAALSTQPGPRSSRRAGVGAGALLALALPAAAQERPELTVYAYDSFVSEFGPGPAIEEAFEPQCGCDLRFVPAGDGAALLSRLRLEGERSGADVVLGLDTNLMTEAAALAIPHEVEAELDLPIPWDDPLFLPFDWSWFAFVHRGDVEPPASFRELAEGDLSVVIQDPRSSTPGLGLVLWIDEAYGEEAGALWEALADNVLTVTRGWSEAYGLFLQGEADMVLSYVTSPAYHLIAEDDPTVKAALFEEGHHLQIEVAAALATSDQPALAREFLDFLTGDAFGEIIPTTNWMYPAAIPEGGLPEGFEALPRPERSLLVPPEEAPERARAAIETWRDALSR
jgi:thiamine transport system substrate-binding protein